MVATPPLRALVRRPSPLMAQACELTHLKRSTINPVVAEHQFDGYVTALGELGAAVTTLAPLAGHADCAFVEDTLLCLPDLLIVCRPGASSRQGEPASTLAAMPKDRPRRAIVAPASLEGGDVLWIGRTLYVGLTTRSNAAGIDQLRAIASPLGYQVIAVPVAGSLHLKTACTALAADVLVINPAWVDPRFFQEARLIEAAPDEPFAGNTLSIGDTVLVATAHPKTAARIAAAGFKTRAVALSEFAKAEAGLTCLSVVWR